MFIIISFFDWQSVSFGYGAVSGSVGANLWHGFGFVDALVAIVFLVWELMRAFGREVKIGDFPPGLISAALAGLLVVLTVIIFLDWSDYRAWPEWVGLILALVIGGFAFMRAKNEGVEMPAMPKSAPSFGGGSGGGSSGGGSSSDSSSSGSDPSGDS